LGFQEKLGEHMPITSKITCLRATFIFYSLKQIQ